MKECWGPVAGWEDFYEVSDQGRVRSKDRTITVLSPAGVLADRTYRGKVLTAGIGKNGYPLVSFTAPGRKREYLYVHHLVAKHFLGLKPPGTEVCHRNNVRSDCKKTNLRWGTRSSNALDRHEHGTMNLAKGEDHFFHKLTVENVRWMRANRHRFSGREIGEMLGVSHGTVYSAINRKTWKHVV